MTTWNPHISVNEIVKVRARATVNIAAIPELPSDGEINVDDLLIAADELESTGNLPMAQSLRRMYNAAPVFTEAQDENADQ